MHPTDEVAALNVAAIAPASTTIPSEKQFPIVVAGESLAATYCQSNGLINARNQAL